ncbi:MAG: hypothetical protein JRI23_22190, partial [Deltaproteobacteria bacterium]|nr:hypothetical protein [Deltaproteobacteria bacterium]MBW2534669.1 hypothetical protein [Deltaproteobacteria bacterium]
ALSLDPGATAVWSDAATEFVDAQLSAFVHAGLARDHVAAIEPSIPWLDEPLQVHVNVDDQCNAYSDLQSIHFYRAGGGCENTARLADVVYHEYGHTVHYQALLDGVGAYESGLSEGLSDYLAATITGDPAVAPGFFLGSAPLRDIDPDGYEHQWPEDIGESHTTGLIMSGALWDLRSALSQKLGAETGVAHADYLMVQAMRRAVDIPSSYVEVLAADDDDGDLDNGTPNACEINRAFGQHGLRAVDATVSQLDVQPPGRDGYRVTFEPHGLLSQCPGDETLDVELSWRLRESPSVGGTLAMAPVGDRYETSIPVQGDGVVVQYSVRATFGADGASYVHFPANPADRFYEMFVGHVEPLYCTGFETDPLADGWTHGALSTGSGHDDWQWGTPSAPAAAGDPAAAFEGTRVYGNDLGKLDGDGSYPPNAWSFAESPAVDTAGFETVRLQYRRWLTVEDGFYDQARVLVGGTALWKNHDSDEEHASLHHRDRQWRFHDVDLSSLVSDDSVAVRFDLRADQGLHFGGWTLDQLCIVGYVPTECGDGRLTGGELCDDGLDNSDAEPDACRTDCQPARCGDGVVDTDEECDGGGGCEPDCTLSPVAPDGGSAPNDPIVVDQCGCRLPGAPSPARTWWLLALLPALVRRGRAGHPQAGTTTVAAPGLRC